MEDWSDFARSANEWLISYYSPPSTAVKPFMIGHAVELYLKATYAKQTGSNDTAIRFGHNVKNLWDACKRNDGDFMLDYEIRDSVFSKSPYVAGIVGEDWHNALVASGEMEHYGENQELYTIAWLLPDLKYALAPPKIRGRSLNSYGWPNPYWVGFFKSIRSYLDYPGSGRRDSIRFYLDDVKNPSKEDSRNGFAYTCLSYLQEIDG